MSDLLYSVNVILPIFIVVFCGYLFRRIGLINEEFVRVATGLSYKVALPLLIFKNIYTSDLRLSFNSRLIGFTLLGCAVIVAVLCLLVPRWVGDRRRCSSIIHTAFRSNLLLLGLPIFINMFGEEHVGPLTMLYPFTIPLFNLLAVIVLVLFAPRESGGRGASQLLSSLRAVATNPLIIACCAGVALQLAGVTLPEVLRQPIYSFADLATPLALLIIGGSFDLKNAWGNLRYSLSATLLKLVAVPLAAVCAAVLLGFRGYELGAIFVVFASPTASSSFIMAGSLDSDPDLTAQVVLLTALFSVLTIFAGVYLLKTIGLI